MGGQSRGFPQLLFLEASVQPFGCFGINVRSSAGDGSKVGTVGGGGAENRKAVRVLDARG